MRLRSPVIRTCYWAIALGHDGCNDADRLRHDRLLKMACDRIPADVGLSSQLTLLRL